MTQAGVKASTITLNASDILGFIREPLSRPQNFLLRFDRASVCHVVRCILQCTLQSYVPLMHGGMIVKGHLHVMG